MSRLTLEAVDTATIRFARVVAAVGLVALLALSAIILANAVMRWLVSQPLEGVRDWVKLVVAIAVGACLPCVLATRQNVTIRYAGRLLGGRREALLDLFGALVVLLAFATMSWLLLIYALELRADGETTENIGMVIWPWWLGVALLFWLSTLVQLLVTIRQIGAVVTGRTIAAGGGAADG